MVTKIVRCPVKQFSSPRGSLSHQPTSTASFVRSFLGRENSRQIWQPCSCFRWLEMASRARSKGHSLAQVGPRTRPRSNDERASHNHHHHYHHHHPSIANPVGFGSLCVCSFEVTARLSLLFRQTWTLLLPSRFHPTTPPFALPPPPSKPLPMSLPCPHL